MELVFRTNPNVWLFELGVIDNLADCERSTYLQLPDT